MPHRSVKEHTSHDRSNPHDGRRTTRADADNVASEMEAMTVCKHWHRAKHLGAKKQFCVWEQHVMRGITWRV